MHNEKESPLFSRKEVEQITGMTAVQIRMAGDQGLLTLDNQFPGRGNARLYTRKNLIQLSLIKELKVNGVELSRVRSIMHSISRELISLSKDDYLEKERLPVHLQRSPITFIIITPDCCAFETGSHNVDSLGLNGKSVIGDRKFIEIKEKDKSGIFINLESIVLSLP